MKKKSSRKGWGLGSPPSVLRMLFALGRKQFVTFALDPVAKGVANTNIDFGMLFDWVLPASKVKIIMLNIPCSGFWHSARSSNYYVQNAIFNSILQLKNCRLFIASGIRTAFLQVHFWHFPSLAHCQLNHPVNDLDQSDEACPGEESQGASKRCYLKYGLCFWTSSQLQLFRPLTLSDRVFLALRVDSV